MSIEATIIGAALSFAGVLLGALIVTRGRSTEPLTLREPTVANAAPASTVELASSALVDPVHDRVSMAP